MGMLINPSTPTSTEGLQKTSEKGQNSGYLGIDSEGNVLIPKELKVTGKVGLNGATPVGKATDMGTLSTSVSITLLTEVAGLLNTTNGKVNEVRTCLRNAGLMS